MLTVHLVVPDTALAEAVAEQLKQETDMVVAEGLPGQAPLVACAFLLDESCDAAVIAQLSAIKNDFCTVLWFGEKPDALDESLVTEFFAKPFRLGHLLARLRFYYEAAPRLRAAVVTIGAYRLEAQQRSLVGGPAVIRLTEKETALLAYLAQSAVPVGRDELLASVWGYDARIDTHTLETHIYQLRRKIGHELIVNDAGLYRLVK